MSIYCLYAVTCLPLWLVLTMGNIYGHLCSQSPCLLVGVRDAKSPMRRKFGRDLSLESFRSELFHPDLEVDLDLEPIIVDLEDVEYEVWSVLSLKVYML